MELILLTDVKYLGKMGDLVKVKNGYGRYLLSAKKSTRATEENKIEFEKRKAEFEAEKIRKNSIAEEVKASLAEVKITIIQQAADDGKLYGSVTAREILTHLKEINPEIEKDNIILHEPLKYLGEFKVTISLTSEISTEIDVVIARKEKV